MGAATYKLAVRCVCGSRARIDGEGELVEHKTPQGTRCYDRLKDVEAPRRRAADVCVNCSLYVCVCSLVAMIWPILLSLSLALAGSGCVTGPDGRRVLSPGARAFGQAMLEQVLTCSVQAGLTAGMSAAANGGPPSEAVLIEASRCHIDLAIRQTKRAIEAAPAPSVEHGRRMLEVHVLEEAGLRDDAIDAARECDAMARGKGGRP